MLGVSIKTGNKIHKQTKYQNVRTSTHKWVSRTFHTHYIFPTFLLHLELQESTSFISEQFSVDHCHLYCKC